MAASSIKPGAQHIATKPFFGPTRAEDGRTDGSEHYAAIPALAGEIDRD